MTRRLVSEEQGVALVLALITLTVLSFTTAAILTATAVNHRSSLKSAQGKQAFALAEQGLADAEGVLYTAVDAGCVSDCVPSATVDAGSGSIAYSGSLAGTIWTLTSTGTVGGVGRTVSEQADVPPPQTILDPTIWNYLYVNSTSSCLTLTGGSQIKVPLYTPGSLCISGGSTFTGSDLEVGGGLTVPDSGSSIGSSSSKITKLDVGGTCYQQKSGKTWPCNGNGPTIWATTAGTAVSPSLTMPTYDLAGLYSTQKAATTSGCPAGLLDNDTTLNASAGTVNVFPTNSSYDCVVGGNELKWNAAGSWSQGTLYVKGSFVIDGSLDLSGGMHVIYTGGGTLFFTSSVKVEGGTSICGGSSGSNNCTGWDPGDWNNSAKQSQCVANGGCNVLILVASCWKANTTGGTQFVSNPCVDITGGSTLQTGTYSAKNFTLEGGSVDQGPVIADTMSIAGGTNILQMLPFYNLPQNTPTKTSTVTSPPGAPTNWSG